MYNCWKNIWGKGKINQSNVNKNDAYMSVAVFESPAKITTVAKTAHNQNDTEIIANFFFVFVFLLGCRLDFPRYFIRFHLIDITMMCIGQN